MADAAGMVAGQAATPEPMVVYEAAMKLRTDFATARAVAVALARQVAHA